MMAYECRTCGIDRGSLGMREDGYCVQCGPPRRKTLYKHIDALTVERDEYKRRLDAVLEMLADNEPGRIHGVMHYTDAQNKQAELYHRARAIAEGKS